ncbi:hypothetical protein KIN20_032862 [Parelaphostrongylus tenuis]|uniref:Uncharacterized protein n=1 Tax=Parelaphostrongylus tenuis TaxID=148309 RepID=A0AAD5WIB8_PARTN|nr:hypothetical protein KIN20_032862 [Parelaphostrongylus tenuis]
MSEVSCRYMKNGISRTDLLQRIQSSRNKAFSSTHRSVWIGEDLRFKHPNLSRWQRIL